MARSIYTVVAVQLPNGTDHDVRALGQTVAHPEIAPAVVGIETDAPKRTALVRLAATAADPTSLSVRAGDLVRTLLERFYSHRQQIADGPTPTGA